MYLRLAGEASLDAQRFDDLLGNGAYDRLRIC